MKTKSLIIAALLVSHFFIFACFAQDNIFIKESTFNNQNHVPDEIVVKFKSGIPENTISALNSKHRISVLSTSSLGGFKRLKISKGRTAEQMVEIYKKNPNVEYAELNYIAHIDMVPNDPVYPYQWHLDNSEYGGINMEAAWDISAGKGVVVAVIDTGVAYKDYPVEVPIGNSGKTRTVTYPKAPDLANTTFVNGWDFINDDDEPIDDNGHGTHVTGTIAQSTNNNQGVAGVAYNCSIMPIKVLNSDGYGPYTAIAQGIRFAVDNGADVINISLSGPIGATYLENAVAYAYSNGVTVVCSSGNNNGEVRYPAAYDYYCIAVGATRYDETRAYYSNYGGALDITAPGGDLNVDQNGDGYGDGVLQQTFGSDLSVFEYYYAQGTSMAAPHVSGVAALLISKFNAESQISTPAMVREALQMTAKDKIEDDDWDPEYGWGVVDAYAALNYQPTSNTVPVADADGPHAGIEDIVVTFDGSGSYDHDGDSLTYLWDFGDGKIGSGVNPTHAYTAGGLYTVTLVVYDGKEYSEPSNTTANITEIDDPPTALAGPDQSASVNELLTFNGSASRDDGIIVSWDWDFGDGQTGSGEITEHAYSSAGTYTVTLTVTDDGAQTDTDTVTVSITDTGNDIQMQASIEMGYSMKKAGSNFFYSAAATVKIKDIYDNQVPGATVEGHWSGATSDIDVGITGDDGTVILNSNELKNAESGTTFTFTLDGVTVTGYIYEDGPISGEIILP